MAISITEILGTDSLSGSRIVINDNFNILTSEINLMENVFNPTAKTLTNMSNITTDALRVGVNTVLLDINASKFDIAANVNLTKNLTLNGSGLFRKDVNPQTLNDTFAGPSLSIEVGTSTAIPKYSIERVGNNTTSTLTIEVNDGSIGQELFFVYSEATTGLVEIKGAVNDFILPGVSTGTPTLQLAEKGDTVHLLCVDDGTGNGEWYLVGGTGYSIA
jgi:hypothetical protein